MTSHFRRHTIIVGKDPHSAQLEKDWFSYQWVSNWLVRHVVQCPQGEFHVVSNDASFTRQQAIDLIDAAIAGKTRVIDLREFSTNAGFDGGK